MKTLLATLFFCLFAITAAFACDGMGAKTSSATASSEVKTCPFTGKTYNANGEEVKTEKVAQTETNAPKVILASAGKGQCCQAGGCNMAAVMASLAGGLVVIFGLVFIFSKLRI